MFKLEEATIANMQAAVARGEISYKELALMYLRRIAEVDSCEGGHNSVLEVNPDALEIARAMDEERARGISRGPLHGIPILLKDNINTSDKMRTTAGSLALADNFAPRNADIVRYLRKAGAVILGKVNMTEFANWMTKGMTNGYSSRGGQVKNPYNHAEDASGSSTGSAVAVAANLCAVSVGTETHGSIVAPAMANGIVGIKPTAGLLRGRGIIPISNTLDTSGPMARTVRDAAILLGVLQGGGDYARNLDSTSLKGLRIGIYGEANDENVEFNAALERALNALAAAGAAITPDIPGVTPEAPWDYIGWPIAKHEFKRCMDHYLSTVNAKMKTLQEIVDFNEVNSDTCLKYGQTLLAECLHETDGRLIADEYIEALHRRQKAANDLNKIFADNNFDILIGAAAHMGIAPLTGLPSGTIPIDARRNGVPIGLYFIARPFDEAGLIRAMYAVEQAIGKRQAPKK
ncbi:MAG: amidase family protein [Defluviitaleaceae bacterium]|nr:amidase family protein [Defluviitaleaceae bacterium]